MFKRPALSEGDDREGGDPIRDSREPAPSSNPSVVSKKPKPQVDHSQAQDEEIPLPQTAIGNTHSHQNDSSIDPGDFILEHDTHFEKLCVRFSGYFDINRLDKERRRVDGSRALEISKKVLSNLGAEALLSVSQVCKKWFKLINNTKLWTDLLKKDKLITDDAVIRYELNEPNELIDEWCTLPGEINPAQVLYK
ncbi:SEC65, partial [Candida margitis]|uniref:SEC65 n=1 Tax=Candida margitis TaxID=1775924 RepID=UPI0022269041